MKKKTMIPIFTLVLAGIFTVCTACGKKPLEERLPDSNVSDTLILTEREAGENLTPTPIAGSVSLHSALQTAYLADDYANALSYADGSAEKSYPRAVRLSWNSNIAAEYYVVEVDDDENFASPMTFTTATLDVNVYNLYLSQTYFWRVGAVVGEEIFQSAVQTFRTESAAPRVLFVDGITNVRDLGGWQTTQGKTVKQGLMYRTGRLNTSWYPVINNDITVHGIRTMRQTMGIRSEIDLRKDYENEVSFARKCVLGDDVHYYACPMEFVELNANAGMVRHIFHLLADENNFPLFFHCDIGTDRTGYIAYLANAVLGVPQESLFRDYLFSNFGRIGSSRTVDGIRSAYVDAIDACAGADLREKAQNYLLSIGVALSDITAFRSIMLGEEEV